MSEPFASFDRIWGVHGAHRTPYMTRAWIGRLRLHVFHRGDADPDHHDHPWPFTTFPLTSYVEQVFDPDAETFTLVIVRRFRLHRRPAEYAHRVLGRFAGEIGIPGLFGDRPVPCFRSGPIVTLVWRGEGGRRWGFWKRRHGTSCWVPWRDYVFGGGKDAPCGDAR